MGMGYKAKTTLALVGAVLALGTAAPAQAATLFGLFNTGVDATGAVIANGSAEQHYVITASTNGGIVTPATPTVVGFNSWTPNDAVGSFGSAWITPIANGGEPGNSGPLPGTDLTYTYTLNFNLGGVDPNDAFLSGNVSSDNVVRILLNGSDIGGQVDPGSPGDTSFFQTFTAFGANSGFVAGANELQFVVRDYGVVTGLRVGDITGAAVPEPGVWAMLIVGFGLVAGQIRRRRRSGTLALA